MGDEIRVRRASVDLASVGCIRIILDLSLQQAIKIIYFDRLYLFGVGIDVGMRLLRNNNNDS